MTDSQLATLPATTPPHLVERNDATLVRLRNLARGSILKHYLKVGEYLLDTYFENDAQLYSDKRRNKEAGFDALLTDHRDDLADMGLQPGVLRNCIRAFIVWRALPETTRAGLDFTHLHGLAPIGDLGTRNKLAQQAVDANWTKREVQGAVLKVQVEQRRGKKKLGRPKSPAAIKQVAGVIRAVRHLPTQVAHLAGLSEAQRVLVRADVTEAHAKMAKILALLDGLPPPATGG